MGDAFTSKKGKGEIPSHKKKPHLIVLVIFRRELKCVEAKATELAPPLDGKEAFLSFGKAALCSGMLSA